MGLGAFIGYLIRKRDERKRREHLQATLLGHDLSQDERNALEPYVEYVVEKGAGSGLRTMTYGFLGVVALFVFGIAVAVRGAGATMILFLMGLGVVGLLGYVYRKFSKASEVRQVLETAPRRLLSPRTNPFPDIGPTQGPQGGQRVSERDIERVRNATAGAEPQGGGSPPSAAHQPREGPATAEAGGQRRTQPTEGAHHSPHHDGGGGTRGGGPAAGAAPSDDAKGRQRDGGARNGGHQSTSRPHRDAENPGHQRDDASAGMTPSGHQRDTGGSPQVYCTECGAGTHQSASYCQSCGAPRSP